MAVLIYTISLLSMLHFLLLVFGFVSSMTGLVGVSIHLLYIQTFHNFSNGKFVSFWSILAFGVYYFALSIILQVFFLTWRDQLVHVQTTGIGFS